VSKILESTELNEIREDERQILEDFEYDLFDVTRVVHNYHNPSAKISDAAQFSMKFAEPKVVKTIDEKVKERDDGLSKNYMSLIDIVLEDHPELGSREEAEKYLQQIITENSKLKTESTNPQQQPQPSAKT
jgi:hypothetical protein